jgi:hypothetical protein
MAQRACVSNVIWSWHVAYLFPQRCSSGGFMGSDNVFSFVGMYPEI